MKRVWFTTAEIYLVLGAIGVVVLTVGAWWMVI